MQKRICSGPNKRRLLNGLFGIAGIAILWFSVSRIGISETIAFIRQVPWWEAALIAVFPFLSLAIAAWRLKWILDRIDGARPDFGELLGYLFAGTSVSILVPSASISGETATALLLHARGVELPRAFAAVFWDACIRFVANTAATFLVLSWLFASGILPFGGALRNLAVLWGLGGLLIAVLFVRRRLGRSGVLTAFAERLFGGRLIPGELVAFDHFVSAFASQKTALLVPFGISLAGYWWEVLQSWMIAWFVGAPVAFPAVLFWHVVTSFSRILPAPSGVGFAEGAGVLAAQFFGVAPALGLGFVLLGRIRDLTIVAVGSGVLLLGRFRRAPAL